jgi:hypothetical protein
MNTEPPEDYHSPETSRGGRRRCAFIHPDGRQCGAIPLADSVLCLFHDGREEIVRKRLEGRKKGGKKKMWNGLGCNEYMDIHDLESLRLFLNDAANAIMSGRMDAKIGNCVASISNVLYRIIEGKDVVDRLEHIESRLDEMFGE